MVGRLRAVTGATAQFLGKLIILKNERQRVHKPFNDRPSVAQAMDSNSHNWPLDWSVAGCQG